jgi:hypothetical protein
MSTPAPPAFQIFDLEDKTRLVYCTNKYNLPQKYLSWKKTIDYLKPCIKTVLTKFIQEGEDWFHRLDYLAPDNGYARCGYLASKVLLADVPPICISEEIIESFLKTDVPPMEVPNYSLPSFIFHLPSNIAKSIANDYDVYVMLVLPIENTTLFDVVCITQKKHLLIEMSCDWNKNLRDKESIGFGHEIGDATNENIRYMKLPDQRVAPKDLDDGIMTTINTLERLIKNAILTYTHEKKYVKDADKNEISFTRGFKDTDDSPMPFRWLGKDFKKSVTKSTTKTLEISGDGQGIRMRPHWRRGHWHNVCTGTKRKERQLRWFKPVFVNAG